MTVLKRQGIFLYGWLILLVSIALLIFQPGATSDLRYHWAAGSIILGTGLFLALLAPSETARRALFLLWGSIFSVFSLASTWVAGFTDGSILAGIFPYADATGYLSDAERILSGESISDFSSRRPLFAAALAGILFLTGNQLQSALMVIVVLVALAIGAAALNLRKSAAGDTGAIVFAILVWLFYRRFVGTTLTEHLGTSVGILGFSAMWAGASGRSREGTLLGLFLLALALNARAGAFFILPALALWGSLFFKLPGRLLCLRYAGWASVAIISAFLLNRFVLAAVGGSAEASFSNFSYSLYGLVYGGDWTLPLVQHPELGTLSPNAQAAEIYKLAWERIHAEPSSLVTGALRAWGAFILSAYAYAAIGHPFSSALLGALLLTSAATLGLFALLRQRHQGPCSMLMWGLVGIFFSVPFVPPWDADMMRAYAATLGFTTTLACLGLSDVLPSAVSSTVTAERVQFQTPSIPSKTPWVGVLVSLIVTLLLPVLARKSEEALPAPQATCPIGSTPAAMTSMPGMTRVLVDGMAGLDKQIFKDILRNPVKFAPRLFDFRRSEHTFALPLPRLQMALTAGHAPEALHRFVASLDIGDNISLARIRTDANGSWLALVVSPEVALGESAETPAQRCLWPNPALAGSYKLSP